MLGSAFDATGGSPTSQGKKRKVGRSEPPLFARGKNFIDGGPSIHQAEALTCDCELCKRELRQVRAQG